MNSEEAYTWLHGNRIEDIGCGEAAEAMRAELEAMRKDAERYRYLRDADIDARNRLDHYAGPSLDVAIDALKKNDAAMKDKP